MTTSEDRPADYSARQRSRRSGTLFLWLIGLLVVAFAGLALQQILSRNDDFTDAEGLRDLRNVKLTEASARGTGWPQWRGPNRDGVSTETGLLTNWPESGPRKLWERSAGKGYSSLAIADGRVYTLLQDGDFEAVVCWDADKGSELWRFRYPCQYQNSYGDGPRATPTVDGDVVYTVGGTGLMHCLKTKPATTAGELVWKRDLLADFGAANLRWGVSFSPLVEGKLIFINPGGPDGHSIAALDKATGTLHWKNLDDPAGYSSPIAATAGGKQQIIFFTGKGLVGVVPDTGALLWSFPWETNYGCNIATPIAVGDYVFLSSGYGNGCAMLKIEPQADGTLKPRKVYQNKRMSNHFSSSVRYRDHLYGFHDGTLTCMDFRTGKVAWTERGFDKGSLLVADGHLIILGERGKLALAEATPDDYREKASFQVSESQCWTVPALANGRLYVRDADKVMCFDVRK
jgi:outer membrane protein assembly factor BamB